MRDFRDAKAMAQTLRETLQAKTITISHSESLEFVSKMLGQSDWNTLSAQLQAERHAPKAQQPATTYPVIPVRDLVAFPGWHFPLFVGRERTKLALDRAYDRHREVVVVAQREGAVDEPGFADIYHMGVLATVFELQRQPDGIVIRGEVLNGTIKVMLTATRRVTIRTFTGADGAYQAEIADISEGRIPEAPELIEKALTIFANQTPRPERGAERTQALELAQSRLTKAQDPGRVADTITRWLTLPLSEKQALLETLDPISRLEKVVAALESAA